MTTSDDHAVEVRALTREFGSRRRPDAVVTALRGIDLTVRTGEVHGLLGPNGAGKTTLCKILTTVLLPSSGTARVCGHDIAASPRAVKPLIGIVFGGDRGLYGRITPRQNLGLWGALYGLHGRELRRRTDALLDRVGLSERADDRVDGFSRGMKQRLHLARGLVSDPQVLILDEPTTGMDPLAAYDFRTLVRELRAEGRTVLITTHDMAEAEAVCDRVTLIDQGRVLATDRPEVLARRMSAYERVEAAAVSAAVAEDLRGLPGVSSLDRTPDGRVSVEISAADTTGEVLRRLVASGVTSLATVRPGLAEVYRHLVQDRGMRVTR
ncbi:ABC transporter ATP-binding protein [Streptomyces sp. NPDC052287]|uniref:ABC transporter ATP-binding protein n=1 Tax=unclassified Streptomyces TaxID=2593676 RepID=UPI002E30C316|nr:ABC transporter ATP-binding protein [Streptomyces sp. NBC_01455]